MNDFDELRSSEWDEGFKEGFLIGCAAERLRISTILRSNGAESRGGLAIKIATETRIAPNIAILLLSLSPAETDSSDGWGRFGSAAECELIAATVSGAAMLSPQ